MACEGGQPPLTEEQISELLPGLSQDWKVIENHHLRREWGFSDFASALEFVNLAGGICEDEGHHADFEVGWGRVKAEIWTHKIDGLTESDFYLAAKFDRIER
ncbi:MAG: pterin-4-alpha-carbinolamine dehydratase [Euryarchaeota archaeon]|nr:pterin-4-alpha-carbinolamine dehydratase [Euryarchaeota archaeon]